MTVLPMQRQLSDKERGELGRQQAATLRVRVTELEAAVEQARSGAEDARKELDTVRREVLDSMCFLL
jgi:cell division protein FtsB